MTTSSIRHSAREYALRTLYSFDQIEMLGGELPAPTPNWWEKEDRLYVPRQSESFARELIQGVRKRQIALDNRIREAAEHWRLERISCVDRNILRIAVYELLANQETPTRVILNEALELAKCYGDEESHRFVNGILDRIARSARPNPNAE